MAKFMVIARGESMNSGLSAAEMQAIFQKYIAWGQRLGAQGKIDHGNKLQSNSGRVVGKVGGEQGPKRSVTDGPFATSKEVIGGYWIINAADYDEAVSLVSDSPHLDYGPLEVRAVDMI